MLFRSVLYHGRQPAFALYLTLDPKLVDVNVHPTKHEVRFRDGRLVHDFLFRSLHRALAEVRPETPSTNFSEPAVSGVQAGEFQQQNTFPLSSEQRQVENQGQQIQAPAYSSGRPSASQVGSELNALQQFSAPMPSMSSTDAGDVPPLGFAIAQLHGDRKSVV